MTKQRFVTLAILIATIVSLLTPANFASAQDENYVPVVGDKLVVTYTRGVNVRAECSAESDLVDKLDKGAQIVAEEVTEDGDDIWVKHAKGCSAFRLNGVVTMASAKATKKATPDASATEEANSGSDTNGEKTVKAPKPPKQLAACPSEPQVRKDLKLDSKVRLVKTGDQYSVPTDRCKYTLQAVGIGTTSMMMAQGYQFTVTLKNDKVESFYGDNVSREVQGATIRYLAAYQPEHWVWDEARLISHEFNFGWSQQGPDNKYGTQPGNFQVEDWNDYKGDVCPTSKVQIAALVGGEPEFWTEPDVKGGAWSFKVPRDKANKPTAFLLLTASEVKDATTWIDYWNGQKNAADKLTKGKALPLADASFHCEAK